MKNVGGFIYPSGIENLARFMGFGGGTESDEIAVRVFETKAQRDFDTIESWIPEGAESVLDIGSGLGGVNILLNRNCGIRTINIIDGDGSEEKKVSFSEDTKAWFDRKIAKGLIRANVGGNCVVEDYPPNPELTIGSDFIISLKSWGHHYPVGVYLGLVKRSLALNGRVVLDIRRRRGDGLMAMKDAGFKHLAKVYETPKCERMVFER